MQCSQDPEKKSLGAYSWLALGVFVGVVTAELLSTRVPSVLAWLVGGTVIGLIPVGLEQPRSASRIVVTTATTASVAALAHWLATRIA